MDILQANTRDRNYGGYGRALDYLLLGCRQGTSIKLPELDHVRILELLVNGD